MTSDRQQKGRDEFSRIQDERHAWVTAHRDAYLSSGGAKGHIMDLTAVGGLPFSTHCLVKYAGRKTGRTYITPLSYCDTGGEVAISTTGGADHRPTQWHQNIRASNEVAFQIATQAFRASWREPEGAERDKIWRFMVDCFPFYATYGQIAGQPLPIILLKALAEISPFEPGDVT